MSDNVVEPVAPEGAKTGARKKTGAERAREQKAKEEAQAAALAALPPGDEDELAAMRHVMNNQTDRTFQHRQLRQIWQTNQDEFRKEYFGLVRAEKRLSRSSSTSTSGLPATSIEPPSSDARQSALPDQGTQNIAELLGDRWVQYQEFKKYRVEFLEWLATRSTGSAGNTGASG